jgi:hypothetical protein
MGEGHRRTLRLSIGMLLIGLAIPAAAVAATNRLAINGPHRATLGVTFNYRVTGNAASSHDHLATFLNTKTKCPSTFARELASPFSVSEVTERVPAGHFTRFFHATPRSKGVHYVCAYLYKNRSKRTVKRAVSKYVTS